MTWVQSLLGIKLVVMFGDMLGLRSVLYGLALPKKNRTVEKTVRYKFCIMFRVPKNFLFWDWEKKNSFLKYTHIKGFSNHSHIYANEDT